MQASESGAAPLEADEEVVMLHPLTAPIPLPPHLKSFRLGEKGAAYVSNILSEDEERDLLREV